MMEGMITGLMGKGQGNRKVRITAEDPTELVYKREEEEPINVFVMLCRCW